MVHWIFLIPAFFLGGLAGIFMLALLSYKRWKVNHAVYEQTVNTNDLKT